MTPEQLKNSILQLAIEGKLVPQNPAEGTGQELLKQIKAALASPGKGRGTACGGRVKPLAPVTPEDQPFVIPDTWCWCRLGEITYSRGQKTPDCDFAYIDIGSIDNLNQKLADTDTILTKDKAPSRARKIVSKGDILYATVRPYLHNMCIVDREFSREPIASTGFAVLSCLGGVFNKFLFYYLLSPSFDSYANDTDNAKGVAYPAINDKKLFQASVPLPPLAEQKRIVANLEELLPLVEEYGKYYNRLQELNKSFPGKLKKSLLQLAIEGKLVPQNPAEGTGQELLKQIKAALASPGQGRGTACGGRVKPLAPVTPEDQPFVIPDTWCWCRLGEICLMYTGNSIPEYQKKSKYANLSDGYCYIGTKDIDFNHHIDYENGIKIPFDNIDFKIGYKNSILLCIEGGSAGRKIAVTDRRVCFGNKLCMFKPYGEFLKFLFAYLQSEEFVKVFKDNLTGIIGGVSIEKLKTFPIPLPPLAEQKRIVAKLEELLPLVEKLEE